ncbi:MAG: universal stress protein [Desulfobacteraceae bacterium]|nr:MAG: universal stress protein [Desulfobacteraceae bacterium]
MAEIKKILFAYEIAEISDDMAPWVELLAKSHGAEVLVLHVVPEMDYYGVPYALPPSRLDDQKELLGSAERKVREFCERNLHVPYKSMVASGKPAEIILKTIRSEGISIAVLGTHGRKGLDRMIFGSVTDRVLRLSPVPIFCIGPAEDT